RGPGLQPTGGAARRHRTVSARREGGRPQAGRNGAHGHRAHAPALGPTPGRRPVAGPGGTVGVGSVYPATAPRLPFRAARPPTISTVSRSATPNARRDLPHVSNSSSIVRSHPRTSLSGILRLAASATTNP